MADITLEAAPTLGGVDKALGACHIRERSDLALVSLAVPLRGKTALTKALKSAFDLAPPEAQKSAAAGEYRVIQTAGDQMMLIFPHDGADANGFVQGKIEGAAYTTDQTDVWVALELSGSGTLPALERLCPLDLDASAFPVGSSARSVMEHMGAIIIRLDTERFLLMSASSSAASFLHALEVSVLYTSG